MAKENTAVEYFHADWCGPCERMEPILDQLDVDITRFDVDTKRGMERANARAVRSLPTIIIVENDKPVEVLTGFKNLEELEDALE